MDRVGENRCVCCGSIIPEGQQVCPLCQKEAEEKLAQVNRSAKRRDCLYYLLDNWFVPLGLVALFLVAVYVLMNYGRW